MTTPDRNVASAKTLNRVLSVVYTLFLYYLILIVQAGLTTVYFVFAPIVYLSGISKRDWNDKLYEIHERVILFLSMTVKGVKLSLHGDFEKVKDNMKENVIVICNHQVEADYFVMAAALEKTGSLSRMRHVMKDSLVWIPFVGGFLVSHGSFFINRKSTDWKRFDENCARIVDEKSPTSVLIYPEGTTFNNSLEKKIFREKSDALARSYGREPFKHVLTPKHKGFHRLVRNLRPHLNAVYDLTFMYTSTRGPNGRLPTPGIVDFFNGVCPEVQIHLRRIDINNVPEDEDAVRDFLLERFQIKNDMLDSFFNSNAVSSKGVEVSCQSFRYQLQSSAFVATALYLGFSSFGLSVLPAYFLLGAVLAYTNSIIYTRT